MYAIEFESRIDNGILKIPKHYKKVIQSNKAKVIILVDLKETKIKSSKSTFKNFLKTSKEVEKIKSFSRDELHER